MIKIPITTCPHCERSYVFDAKGNIIVNYLCERCKFTLWLKGLESVNTENKT